MVSSQRSSAYVHKNLPFSFLSQPEMWKKCLDCIDELLDILFGNNNIFIGENIAEDSESLNASEQVSILIKGGVNRSRF